MCFLLLFSILQNTSKLSTTVTSQSSTCPSSTLRIARMDLLLNFLRAVGTGSYVTIETEPSTEPSTEESYSGNKWL